MPKAPTPHSRLLQLLSTAIPLLSPTSNEHALSLLTEALSLANGLDPYLEQNTCKLVVPKSHPVPENEVRKVWGDLLKKTETTDWRGLQTEGKTRFVLDAGMVCLNLISQYITDQATCLVLWEL